MGFVVPIRARQLATILIVASCTLGSCSANNPAEPDSSPGPSVRDKYLEFPLDAYQETPKEAFTIDAAIAALVNSCGERFGFSNLAVSVNLESTIAQGAEGKSRFYGIRDLDAAKQRGYRLDPKTNAERPNKVPSATEYLVMAGAKPGQMRMKDQSSTTDKVAGKRLPAGGCYGEANRTLFGGNGIEDELVLAGSLASGAAQLTQADPRVSILFKKWSTCMAGKGFKQKDPYNIEGFNIADGKPPTALEIQTAVADVECKEKNQMIPQWHAVWVEYEKKALEKNQLALTEERTKRDLALKKAVVALEQSN